MSFKKYILAICALTAIVPALAFAVEPAVLPPIRFEIYEGVLWRYVLNTEGTAYDADRPATPAEAAALNPARPVPAPATPVPPVLIPTAPPVGLPRTNLTPPLLVAPLPSTVVSAGVSCALNTSWEWYQGTYYNAGEIYICRYQGGAPVYYPKYPPGLSFNIPRENDAFRNIAFNPAAVRFDTATGRFVIPDVSRFDMAEIRRQMNAGLITMPPVTLPNGTIVPGRPLPADFFRIYFEGNANFHVFIGGEEISMPRYVEPRRPVVRPTRPNSNPFLPTDPRFFQSESGTLTNIGAPNTGPSGAGPGPSAGDLPGASGLPGASHDPGNNLGFDIPPLPIPIITWNSPVRPPIYQIYENGRNLTWMLVENGERFFFSMGDYLPAGRPDGIFEIYITRMVPNTASSVPGALRPAERFNSFEEYQRYVESHRPPATRR